jgi:hypothetical protein
MTHRARTAMCVPSTIILNESGFSEFCVCKATRKVCTGGRRRMPLQLRALHPPPELCRRLEERWRVERPVDRGA